MQPDTAHTNIVTDGTLIYFCESSMYFLYCLLKEQWGESPSMESQQAISADISFIHFFSW